MISRRKLLIGGGAGVGLVLAWGLWPREYRHNLTAAPGEQIFNAFVKIGQDGHVAVVVPQAEMGQGVWTALPQLLADELGADWRTVSVEPAPINPLYANDFLIREGADEMLPAALRGIGGWAAREIAMRSSLMITGGSTSIRGFEQRFREAGAAARALLCAAAAARAGADWRAFDTIEGFVVRGEERLRFAELAVEASVLPPPEDVALRGWRAGGLAGQSLPRLDLPSKVDGTIRFAADVRLPDMLHASVRRRPVGGETRLAGLDTEVANAVPGMVSVVSADGWVGAVASNWWAADTALQKLDTRFSGSGALANDADIEAKLKAAIATGEGGRFAFEGDLASAFRGQQVIQAEYAVPFAPHAAIEPLCATARVSGDRAEIWMPTQAPAVARDAVAAALGLPAAHVTIYAMPIGGGFGRKIETDAAVQAAQLSDRVRRPVQLTWSREEELRQGYHRPPARARMTARMTQDGSLIGWQARIATPSTAGELQRRLMPGLGAGSGGAEAAAVAGGRPPYAIPALSVDHLPVDLGVPTGMWRSVAHSYTAFFTECFVDELAAKADADPFGFRIRMLGGQPRLANCLTTVTAKGGWQGAGAGQGLAIHSAFGSHVAMLAEAGIKDGRIKVDRIVAVVDCGRIVNPDIVRQQVEGGIVWGLAATLGGAIGYEEGRATADNFDGLMLPTLADTPEIQVELIRSGAPSGGIGEVAVPPVAPAIANALFASTGRRQRVLPLTL